MSKDESRQPSEALAMHLARKGADEVEKLQATIQLARQLLASGEVQQYGKGENPYEVPPYPWEVTEARMNAPRRIYLGTVRDLTTGEGYTIYFAAGLARDEDEFRRQMASQIGHTLANGAKVQVGTEDLQFSRAYMSPSMKQTLETFDNGRNAPAAFFFLSRWHENQS